MKTKGLIKVFALFMALSSFNLIDISAQENGYLTNNDSNRQLHHEEFKMAKTHLTDLLSQNAHFIRLLVGNDNYTAVTVLGAPNEIKVLDDHIEFIYKDNRDITTQTINLFFSYILEEKIKSKLVISNKDDGSTISENHLKLRNVSIVLSEVDAFLMKSLVNDLTIIQKTLNDERFKMDEFKSMVAEYHLLKEKPMISEEQRKYIIQANAFAEIMEYDEAISSYIKVLGLNKVSYPEAYYNIALLLGQRNKYHAAINFMKKYLLLVPNSTEINKANDRIKDWEIMLQN